MKTPAGDCRGFLLRGENQCRYLGFMKEHDDQKNGLSTGNDSSLIAMGVVITVAYLFVAALFLMCAKGSFGDLKLNEAGDFLAGVFAPLAFLWLVLGFLQQGKELRAQIEELRHTVEASRDQAKAQKRNADVARLTALFELEKMSTDRIRVSASALQQVLEDYASFTLNGIQVMRLFESWRRDHINEMKLSGNEVKLFGRLDEILTVLEQPSSVAAVRAFNGSESSVKNRLEQCSQQFLNDVWLWGERLEGFGGGILETRRFSDGAEKKVAQRLEQLLQQLGIEYSSK